MAEVNGHCRQEFLPWALSGYTDVLIGVKLPPLEFAYPSPELLRRALVLTYLASFVPPDRSDGRYSAESRYWSRRSGIFGIKMVTLMTPPPLSILLSRTTRAYTAAVTVDRIAPFLDSMTLAQLAQRTKARMIDRLISFRDRFEAAAQNVYTNYAFQDMVDSPHLLMKLCHVADELGLILTDIFEAWAATEAGDLDLLIAELRDSSDNLALAYAGQDFDEL